MDIYEEFPVSPAATVHEDEQPDYLEEFDLLLAQYDEPSRSITSTPLQDTNELSRSNETLPNPGYTHLLPPFDTLLLDENTLKALVRDQIQRDVPVHTGLLKSAKATLKRKANLETLVRENESSTYPKLAKFLGIVKISDINKDQSLTCVDALASGQNKLVELTDTFRREVTKANLEILTKELDFVNHSLENLVNLDRLKEVLRPTLARYIQFRNLRLTDADFNATLCNLCVFYPPFFTAETRDNLDKFKNKN